MTMRDQEAGNVVLLPMTAGQCSGLNPSGGEELNLSRSLRRILWRDQEGERSKSRQPTLGEVPSWSDALTAGRQRTPSFHANLADSEKWKSGPGPGQSVNWPAKGAVGGAKNDGVAALVQRTPGAIGYIEYAFAATSGQPTASLQNKAGKFVAPTLQAATAALAHVELPVICAPGHGSRGDSYPIATYTGLGQEEVRGQSQRGSRNSSNGASPTVRRSPDLHYLPCPRRRDAVARPRTRSMSQEGIRAPMTRLEPRRIVPARCGAPANRARATAWHAASTWCSRSRRTLRCSRGGLLG